MLARQYPFFPMDPQNRASSGGERGGFCHEFNGGVCVPDSHANTATCVTGVINHTQGISVPHSTPNKLRLKSKPQNEATNLQDQNVTEGIPLPTPVSVHNIERCAHKFSGATCP